MAKFTVDEIRGLTARSTNIRNISVIGAIDGGASTLTDLLVSEAGIISSVKANKDSSADTHQSDQGGCTIAQPIVFPVHFRADKEQMADIKQKTNGSDFLINLIDSPRHADFISGATAALRVTDGALVAVDAVEGVSVKTEAVLRQALAENTKPAIFINHVDQMLFKPHESLYQSFQHLIERINVVISTCHIPAMGDVQVCPDRGTIAFGSSLHAWAFTLRQFAAMYARKFGVAKSKLMAKLWGENYFNIQTKKWAKKSSDTTGRRLDRGFSLLVLDPIYKLYGAITNGRTAEALAMAEKLSIPLTSEDKSLEGTPLLKAVMRRFLPAAEALFEMVCIGLPSPVTAQAYRCEALYGGPMDDECATGIRKCDPSGPLMLYVSQMVPTSDKSRFYALGRVFSGTARSGMKVRIQGPSYVPGKKEDLFIRNIQRTVLMMGRYIAPIEDCPAGNIVGLVGVDQYLLKAGTLTTSDTAHSMKVMKFSALPVIQVAVDVENASDLPKLVEGLRNLSKCDPCVQCFTTESGEHIVAGASELHLEACLKDLAEEHAQVPIKTGNPVVSYRETVQSESSIVALAKSPNRHTRIFMKAEPMDEELARSIECGNVGPHGNLKARARILADRFDWDASAARKIWCFGPENTGANVFVDATKGVQYLSEIKDSCVAAFKWTTKEGPCAEEPMRGCRFNILDVFLFSDAIHRGAGQIIPACRRAIYASTLLADPGLQEPIYLVEIQCPESTMGGVYSVLSSRRGQVISEEQHPGTSLYSLKAHLPAAESFGFAADLRSSIDGQAFPCMLFDHWQLMNGISSREGIVKDTVVAIRTRKGLAPEVPAIKNYLDKL